MPPKAPPPPPEPEPVVVEEPPEPQPVPPLSEEEFEERAVLYREIISESGNAIELKEKSRAERKASEKQDIKSLTYGELELPMVHEVLNKVKAEHATLFPQAGVFLDLGSGAGKACIAAALLHPFRKVVGIETMQCLHSVASDASVKYKEVHFPDGLFKPELEFIAGDFVADFEAKLEAIAPEVVLCLAVATCYGEAELNAMATVASKMPDESIFITFTQGLPERIIIDLNRNPAQRRAVAVKKALAKRGVEPSTVAIVVDPPINDPFGWTLVHSEDMQLMWGVATCFIYKKVVFAELRPEPPKEAPLPDDA